MHFICSVVCVPVYEVQSVSRANAVNINALPLVKTVDAPSEAQTGYIPVNLLCDWEHTCQPPFPLQLDVGEWLHVYENKNSLFRIL
jgi:hypothetical protein